MIAQMCHGVDIDSCPTDSHTPSLICTLVMTSERLFVVMLKLF